MYYQIIHGELMDSQQKDILSRCPVVIFSVYTVRHETDVRFLLPDLWSCVEALQDMNCHVYKHDSAVQFRALCFRLY